MAFSPDGAWLAAGDNENRVRVWDALTGQTIYSLPGHTGRLHGVAFSSDGQRIASASHDKSARIWDASTGDLIRVLEGHTDPVWSVAFRPDGKQIASGAGELYGRGEVTIWDTTTGEKLCAIPGANFAACAEFGPDNRSLASAGDGQTVRVWDPSTGRELFWFPGDNEPITTVAYSPRGDCLAAAGWSGTIMLWDVARGRSLPVLKGHTSAVRSLAFSPDGTRIASASRDQTVKVWDMKTYQEVISLRGHTDTVRAVAFSPDGTRIASSGIDGTLRVWDARPSGPEAPVEREALALLNFLFFKPLRKADVTQYLETSPTITPRARELALSLVARYHEETNPETYHQASWDLVRQPYLNAFQYRFALLQAEHACRLAPDRQDYRTGQGAALYRAGRSREAIETLEAANGPDTGSPAVLAFLSMAHHRLGQRDQARADFARLRKLLDGPDRTQEAEAVDLMHEAQALIAPQVATTER